MAQTTISKRPVSKVISIPRELRQKAEAILSQNFDYMDSPLFHKRDVEQELFNEAEPQLPEIAWYQPTREDAIEQVKVPKLMNAQEERQQFFRFNFSKLRLTEAQRKARTEGLTRVLAEEIVEWHRRYELYREYLTRTNLALVLAMAKRSRLGDVDFSEVVSEGNMALLRAVEKFNVDRGFKFSTYACRAILKAFSRTSMKSSRYRMRFPVEFAPDLEKSDWADTRRDQVEEDCLDELRAIVDRNLADLSSVEETVIRRRFNWEQKDDSALTLEQVGQIIGVTKERVRQIQNKALAKIRGVMEDGVLRSHPREAVAVATPDRADE